MSKFWQKIRAGRQLHMRRAVGRAGRGRGLASDWAVQGLEPRVLLTAPTLKVLSVAVPDPNTGTTTVNVKVTLSAATTSNVTFNYATADNTAKVADGDYVAVGTTAGVIPAGQTSITIPLTVKADPIATEADENFTLNVVNVVNAANTTAKGTVTIQNDDNALAIGNVTQSEGTGGTTIFAFPVTLSGPTTSFPVTVSYKTTDGTAKVADGDYAAASGTLTIPAGQAAGTINVVVHGDTVAEPSEAFSVTLSSPKSAIISTAKGTGTILDSGGPSGWTALGPAPITGSFSGNVSGRLTGLATDPTNFNTIYAAAAGGGIWKTTDGGTSWLPLTDSQVTTAIGAVAVAPSNHLVVYAGTGESNNSGDSLYGRGILKSADGGATWTLGGNSLFDRLSTARIVVSPTDPNTVYAAMSWGVYNGFINGGNTGVWKSTDGGTTWSNTTAGVSTTDEYSDLVMDPTNPLVLYAAVGTLFGGAANGVYKTTDGGASWALAGNFPSGNADGRIALAIAPSNASELFAAVENPQNGGLLRMEKSTDGGASWSQLTGTPDFTSGQGWYDLVLAVSPTDANRVFAAGSSNSGGFGIIESTNGGTSWADISLSTSPNGPHTDAHAFAYEANGKLLEGNDGGIWRLDNPSPTSPQWTDLNGNLNITQVEGVGVDPNNANSVIIGTQDNGTSQYNGTSWAQTLGGDGGIARIDPVTPSTRYSEFTGISLRITKDGGASWASATGGIGNDNAQFYVPYTLDPSNHLRLVLGTSRVYETTNQGTSWVAISGVLSPSTITAVAVAPTAPSTIFVAYADGTVWGTTNDGASWSNLTTGLAAGLQIHGIAVDPNSSSTVYLTSWTFGADQVWKGTGGGTSWSNISHNLPDIPAHAIALDGRSSPTILYVGTDAGVFESKDGGGTWALFKTGLPNVSVYDMQLSAADNVLTVGTHGRGVWQVPITATGALADPAYQARANPAIPTQASPPSTVGAILLSPIDRASATAFDAALATFGGVRKRSLTS